MDDKTLLYIKQLADNHNSTINRNVKDSIQLQNQTDLLKRCEKIVTGEMPFDDETLSLLKINGNYEPVRFLEEALGYLRQNAAEKIFTPWNIADPIIQKLINHENVEGAQGLASLVNRIIAQKFTLEPSLNMDEFLKFLYKRNFTDQEIITTVFRYSGNALFYPRTRNWNKEEEYQERQITKFGEYIKAILQPKKGILGFKKESSFKDYIDDFLLEKTYNNSDQIFNWLLFLYMHYQQGLTNGYQKYFYVKDYQNKKEINFDCIYFLIEKEALQLDTLIVKAINEVTIDNGLKFSVYMALNEKLNGKYHDDIVKLGESYLKIACRKLPGSSYYYDSSIRKGYFSEVYANYLLKQNREAGIARIERLLNESDFIFPHFLKFLDEQFGAGSVPYIIDTLFKETSKNDYYTTIFSILEKYDIRVHLPRIMEFMIQYASNKTREQGAVLLSKYIDEVMPVAIGLVTEKTVDQRITGALILSVFNTEKSNAILNDAVDQETNDDTRDIMLEALSEKRFASPYSMAMVNDMIAKADTRKKLSRWSEKWIDEENLPKLYWKGEKRELSIKDIRFLIYRMKRAKGLNSDIEAKQLLNLIDRDSSNKFAKAMLVAFQDSNSDPKLKSYLTIAGLLGDDDVMHNLNVLFKKNIADKRMKMAEYVIGALAMIGTNKALRIVEVIYRKFANKKPAISVAAKEALTAAASELNINMDELADRIIPNFDFEGLYRKFEVDGEEFRAFINSDFSLSFINEDNKSRKSIPANTSKELKTEFKEIEKEIRDIVKSQSGRLEKYMLEERRWPTNDWHSFFFINPIMFVYALKLVWGVFDKNNTLLNVFYCSEDSSLYNIDDEEVELDAGQYIGILHPIYLTPSDLKLWHDKIYEMKMTTIFPVFERAIFTVEENEKELNNSRMFFGRNVPKGADFVNTFMVKKNWMKSTGDGGSSEFTKWCKDEYYAYASIEGPMAFYQGGETPATVYQIMFMTKDRNAKVKLKDLPPVFYSEVMSDIDQLIKAE